MSITSHCHRADTEGPDSNHFNKDSVMAWGSFIGIFTWYHIIFYNYTNSPLRVLLETSGFVNTQTILALFIISTAAVMFVLFLVMRDKDMYKNRPLWYVTHSTLFISAVLLPIITNYVLLCIFVIICGVLSGAVFFRNLYTSCFHASKSGWIRILIGSLIYFNIFIHLYALVPETQNPKLMYAVSLVVLVISLVMSLAYHGNTLEIRRFLPDNKLTWRGILPVLVLFFGVTFCFAAYKAIVNNMMTETPDVAKYQAIVCAIALVVLFALGDRLGQSAYLTLLLALITGAVISFQILGVGGQMFVESFIQPAYLCWNITMFSYLRSFSHLYGKSHMRYRIIIVLFLVSVILPEVVAKWFFETFLSEGLGAFAVLYAVVFVLILMITRVGRTTEAAEQEVYTTGSSESFAQLSDQICIDIDDALTQLMDVLPPEEHLTKREHDVLKLILERQDIDVMSYVLGISGSTVRTHISHICEKFGVHSRTDLINTAGMADEWSRFSSRELDVLRLVVEEKNDAEIAESLYIASNTVRTHIHNLYVKCGVKSRKELIRFYNKSQTIYSSHIDNK